MGKYERSHFLGINPKNHYYSGMKTLYRFFLFVIVGLANASAQSNLPACQGSDVSRWINCVGSNTFANGNKYVGEHKDGKPNGQCLGLGISSLISMVMNNGFVEVKILENFLIWKNALQMKKLIPRGLEKGLRGNAC